MSGCGSESEKHMELANEYFANGQYDYAAYNYVRSLDLERENETAYLNLIDSYIALGKLDKAMDYLEEAELMFGARAVEDKREILEGMMPEPTPKKEEPAPTEVPVVEETPMPDVTVEPTDAPVIEPTEVPESTVTSAPEYTFTDIDATMYVTADVNVRTLPSTDGKKVGSLSKDTKIDVLRQCNETGWYEFEYDGELRYASSKYFSTEKPEVKVTSTPVPTSTPTPKSNITPIIDYKNTLIKYKDKVDVIYDRVDDDYSVRPKNLSGEDNLLSIIGIFNDGTVRFSAQLKFIAYDWIFTEEIKIACGDTTYTFEVDFLSRNTDILSGGKITESMVLMHSPEMAGMDAALVDFEPIISSIKNSNEVIIRFSGDGYKDFYLSDKDKENIIMMWEIYLALEYDSGNIKYIK